MLLDEKSTEEIISRPKLEDCKIDCQNVTVKWPAAAETEDNTLTDVSFSVSPGQVLAVVGQVGSGKVILRLFDQNNKTNINITYSSLVTELIIKRDSWRTFMYQREL